MDAYLAELKHKYQLDDILGWLDGCAHLVPLVIGEAIIDEYVWCDPLGTANKDPVLVVQQRTSEMHAGGALAVANHLAGLCEDVRLIAQVGDRDSYLDFIGSALKARVSAQYIAKRDAPTVRKRRYVDFYSGAKMFEINCLNDEPVDNPYQSVVKEALIDALPYCDLIVAADFGHGFFNPCIVRQVWAAGKFLALNVQANTANHSWNTISKWPRADYVSLNQSEVNQELRTGDGHDRDKLLELARRVACPEWTVTLGKRGMVHFNLTENIFTEAPALARKIVDRTGAGDCVFAVTSLLVKLGAPADVICFVGNAAGAYKVEYLGNAQSIDKAKFSQFIKELWG